MSKKQKVRLEHLVGDVRYATDVLSGMRKEEFLIELAALMSEYRVCKIDIGLSIFEEYNNVSNR